MILKLPQGAGRFMLKLLNRIKYWQWPAIILPVIVFFWFLIPPSSPIFNDDYSTVVLSENGYLLHAFLNKNEQWHFPPDTCTVEDKLKTAVITFEDESFYSHIGVDFKAVFRAARDNFRHGRVTSGASTIPMQIARMRHQRPRTYFNKIREAFFAIKLTLHYSREDLLRIYLDHAPYGGNVIGYRTASLMFFDKPAYELTWAEAATLAVLPNAPGLIYPSERSSALLNRRNQLLQKLHEKGHINELTLQLALLEPVPQRFHRFQSHAPHLAFRLRRNHPQRHILPTTISEELQKKCNHLASIYRHRYSSYGIHNLAILVTDTKSGAVKSYVGSPDFFDFDHGGQVDGVMAWRSSGSILKPFLYGLSIDEGLISSESFIRDLPTYFDGFSPRNASREYSGVATARDALVQSLNIPAVRLLNAYGLYQFYSFLESAGMRTLFRTADEYGLPLILGGSEVTMWEMTKLYRGLANEGVFSDNYVIQGEKNTQSVRLMSPGSCYLVLDMLHDLKRPGSEYYWYHFNSARPFAWKTGTSYGHKDAWAIGVNPDYTIAVWVGNFNGEGNKNLSGATSAGAILFDVLQSLPFSRESVWFQKSDIDYRQQKVCKLSGFRATDACPDYVMMDLPWGMKPLKTCNYHQFKFFSDDGKHQTCSRCWTETGSNRKPVLIYPPDVAYYLRAKGQFIEPIAGHNPECPAYRADEAVKIIYPDMEAKVFLPRDFDGQIQPVVCRAGHISTSSTVYWYLDDEYLGESKGEHRMSVVFRNGWNTLKIVDESGASDSRRVFATMRE
ncbi:penicillin-binding protein 1C [Alkalitalea saponilacus]|nr:penicillin-binding protein 1C [Alkalitalea saponilacus]ASB50123.1 penicillin-binding protein 1C [Alkalitalea saponilacus]